MDLRKKKNRATEYATIALMLCVAVVLVLGLIKLSGESDPPAGPAVTITSDPNAVAGPMEGFSNTGLKNPEDLLTYRINGKPYFKNDKVKGNVLIENPAENLYLMQVDYEMMGTLDIVYQTGYIAPGQYIPEGELMIPLDNGVYDITAWIYAIDPATYDIVDVLEQPIQLYVGKDIE